MSTQGTEGEDKMVGKSALVRSEPPFYVLALVLGVGGCTDRGTVEDGSDTWLTTAELGEVLEDCVRPPPNPDLQRGVITLSQTRDFPCRIVEMPVEVEIVGTVDGSVPSPGVTAVMTKGGQFYARDQSSAWLIHKWDRDGAWVASYGKRGDGPGEFGGMGSPTDLLLDLGDSLFVRDGRRTWSVFDHDLTFVRSFPGTFSSGPSSQTVHVTDDRHFLSTTRVTGDPDRRFYFYLMDMQGDLVKGLGEIPSRNRSELGYLRRTSAYAGGNTFWVTPPDGMPGGIALEEWTLDGELLRTIRREVPWFPRNGYQDATERAPYYGQLVVDEHGLLWYGVAVRGLSWRPPEERSGDIAAREGVDSEPHDLHIEVIDPAAGVVLASIIFEAPINLPFSYGFPGSRMFYRFVPDSLGLNTLEVFEARLIQAGQHQALEVP